MKSTLFILTLILVTSNSFSQTNDLPKREAFNLTVAVDETNFYNEDIKASPYIFPDNTIQLYPGETIYVEVELVKKKINGMKTVKENLNPEKTLVISFTQQTDGKIHSGMTLKIENPFDKILEYKATMFLLKFNKWYNTNVLPIPPKLSAYELWPDVIISIALSEWKFK